MRKNKCFNILFCNLSFIVIFIILFPVINIFLKNDIQIFKQTLVDKEVISSILLTARASLYASIFGIIFGVPLAYILARGKFFGKAFLESVIDIPVIIPHSAAGIALLGVFGRKFFVGDFFNKLGISFVGTEYGIALAMFFVSIPFLINGAKEGFKLVDKRYEHVAMTLGASKFKAFKDITLPLSLDSILSGVIMMWARGISEFGAVIILAYHPMTASVKIFERFEAYGLNYARPVAVMLILVCLSIFVVLRLLVNNKGEK